VYDFTFRKRDPLHTEKVLDNKKNLKKKVFQAFTGGLKIKSCPYYQRTPNILSLCLRWSTPWSAQKISLAQSLPNPSHQPPAQQMRAAFAFPSEPLCSDHCKDTVSASPPFRGCWFMHMCSEGPTPFEQSPQAFLRETDAHSHLGRNAVSFLLPHKQTLPLVLPQGGSHPLQMAVKDKFINIWW
jgi:hypothetical protein